MLQAILIGNIGADAKVNVKDGSEFTTFRVAHNDTWTDANGTQHSNTLWVDCIMNGKPNVVEYLKQGTQVAIMGNITLRTYSSEKDRCIKAGMTIKVTRVELLGGRTDDVPSRLYDTNGAQHDIKKAYYTDAGVKTLRSQRGQEYDCDDNGWVTPKMSDTSNQSNNDPVY